MSKFTNPLDNVSVASPCSQDWNAMVGGEQKRYCGDCKLNVYNLSGMTRAEAENLIMNAEGRLCVRFYRRADGTILTQDCPVGWQAIKRRVSRTAAAFASLFFGLLGGLGLATAYNQTKEIKVGRFLPVFSPTPKDTKGEYITGNFAVPTPTPKATPREVMGAIAAPTPTPKKKDAEYEIGKLEISRN